MAISEIPLRPIPSQVVQVTLADQPVTLYVRELGGKQYLSASWDGVVLCESVQVVNRSGIIRAPYTGFIGDIAAYDTQGDEAPQFAGWGTRWRLLFNSEV